MTARRPLRLRWSDSPLANSVTLPGRWYLHLVRDAYGPFAESLTVGYVARKTAAPNTYEARTATGAILRGNNRRRLMRRLRDAVKAELREVGGVKPRRVTVRDLVAAAEAAGQEIELKVTKRRGRAA